MAITFSDDYNPSAVESEAQRHSEDNDSFAVEIGF